MSYDEYFDLYKKAQLKKCPFRAFCIDVVNSKKVLQENQDRYLKMFKLFDYISLQLLKKNKDKPTFRNNETNKLNLVLKNINYNSDYVKSYNKQLKNIENLYITNLKNVGDTLLANPMINGDCACYFINENTLTEKEFLEILKNGMEKFNVDFDFHFKSAKYETEDYAEGDSKLYKGYVFPMLEKISKKEGLTITHKILEK